MSIAMAVQRSTVRKLERLTTSANGRTARPPRGSVMGVPKFGLGGFTHPGADQTVAKLIATLVESEGGNMARLMALFDDMRERDARLDAVCRTRVLAITGKDWALRPPTGMEHDADALGAVDEVTRLLSLCPDLSTLIAQLMDGALRGYSVIEIEWGTVDGRQVPINFAWRDPGRFSFDDKMRICRSDATDGWPGILLSDFGPDRFIIHSPSAGRACYPTRRGALRPCMWPSMTKRYGLRWWLVAAERFGQPAPILKVPDGDDNLFDDAADMLRGLTDDWQAVLTQGMELELLPGSGDFSGDLHAKMVEFANTEMAICILGQNLSTEVQGGSFAAAKVHDAVRLDYLASDAQELAETLRRELLEPLVRYNLPGAPVPEWDFTLVQPETAALEEWHVTTGILSMNEARESLGHPALTEAAAAEHRPEPRAEREPTEDEAARFPELPAPEVVQTEAWCPANMVVLADEDWKIVGTPEQAVEQATERLNPWARWAMGELRSRIEKYGAGDWRQRRALEEWARLIVDEDGPEFTEVIGELLMRGDMAGRLSVAGIELGADRTIDLRDVVQLGLGEAIANFFRAPFEAAIAFFQRKEVVSPAEFDAMDNRWREGAFIARRLANDRLDERARQIVAVGMDQQLTGRELAERLERELGLGDRSWYAETITRTNLASAYGAGRHAQLTAPEVRGLRPFLQYRSIGDSRVRGALDRPITRHAKLNGLVFVNGSELADQYAPPLGFNCRCQMVSLTKKYFERKGLADKLTRDYITDGGRPYLGDKGWTQPARRALT